MIGQAIMLAQAENGAVTLTPGGATIMTLSVLLVLGLCGFCFWRLQREPRPSAHHHAPLDIDTRDLDD